MTTEHPEPGPDNPAPPPAVDLRSALMADLKEQFKVELTGKVAITEAQRNALLEVIGGNAPTAAEIVKALTSKPTDPTPSTNG